MTAVIYDAGDVGCGTADGLTSAKDREMVEPSRGGGIAIWRPGRAPRSDGMTTLAS